MVNDKTLFPQWRKTIVAGAVILFVMVFVVVLATSYSASLYLIFGMIIAWFLYFISKGVILLFKKLKWPYPILISTILGFMFCGFLLYLLPHVSYMTNPPPPPALIPPIVEKYKVSVEMLAGDTFKLQESVVPGMFYREAPDDWISLPSREIASHNIGFLLREIYIAPLDMDQKQDVKITLPDGKTYGGEFCGDTCPQVTVELVDFPKDAFFEAKTAENIERFPYIDTETITWSVRLPNKGIAMAYIRPPFQLLHSILTPFLGISSFSQWTVAMIGLFISIIFIPIVLPVFNDMAQDRLKTYLEKRSRKKTRPHEVR